MKKIQIITIFLFVIISSFSQENKFEIPNYKNIQKENQKKESNFYYPKLLERLEANDTLLSKEEYKHLYFGYLFQPKYNAYWTSPDQDKLSKYYSSEKLEEKDYDQMIKLANHSILDFPFDMRNMNFLAYINHLKGDEISAKKMTIRFNKSMEAILSSGDGKNCETGFHVISVSHEYVLLHLFELESNSQSLIDNCDYLSFEKGKYKVDGIYFNIKKLLEKEREILFGK